MKVQRNGHLTVADAIRLGDDKSGSPDPGLADEQFSVITWDVVAQIVRSQAQQFNTDDISLQSTVARVADEIVNSVHRHR